MLNMTTIKLDIVGRTLGASTTYIMEPVIIFKGKLMAAANRNKYSDIADLTWLADKYSGELISRRKELSRHMVGEILRRHSHLERTFGRLIGEEALRASKATSWTNQPLGAELNQVQNGVLFGLPAAGVAESRTRSKPPESGKPDLGLSELDLGHESDSDCNDDGEEADSDSQEADDGGRATPNPVSGRAQRAQQAIQALMARGLTREQADQRIRAAAVQNAARQ